MVGIPDNNDRKAWADLTLFREAITGKWLRLTFEEVERLITLWWTILSQEERDVYITKLILSSELDTRSARTNTNRMVREILKKAKDGED